jgi:hypothetical protein
MSLVQRIVAKILGRKPKNGKDDASIYPMF